MTMSLASLVISEPEPMAIPISACFIAGASLTPSPVTATTAPVIFKASTTFSFTDGVLLAITPIDSIFSFNTSIGMASISSAITTSSDEVIIPVSIAIAAAVTGLSPVIILTSIPAFLHAATDDATSFLTGSAITA